MERVGSFELDRLEMGTAITCGVFLDAFTGSGSESGSVSAGAVASSATSTEYFIVGTAQVVNDEAEPSRGRLLLFEITADKRILLVTEKATKGAVFSMAMLQGKVAAGIGSKVFFMSVNVFLI